MSIPRVVRSIVLASAALVGAAESARVLRATVPGQLPAPEGLLRHSGAVALEGDWADADNFSGVVQIGTRVLIASDEIGRLQSGTMTSSNRIDRGPDVALAGSPDVERDIEALAVSGTTVYALGSHSATRRSGDDTTRQASRNRERLLEAVAPRPERDVLFRFTYDSATGTATDVRQTSLRAALGGHPLLKPFALLAGKENGIDLEGLAVDGTTLFAAFRGPVLRHGLTPVWRFTFEDPGAGTLLLVTLDGRGIRDLVKVSDGFLVLAGPVGDADTLHRVYWWNGSDCVPGRGNAGGSLRLLGEIVPPAPNGKAEVLLIRNEGAKAYDVLVAFDSLPKGGISRYSIPRMASLHSPGTRLCGAGG